MDPGPSYYSTMLVVDSVSTHEPISIALLLLTVFLVFLNGFFVAAEFAIVKVRASQIQVKSKSNKRISNTAKNIVNHLDSYLAATQLGITLASLGLGWVGEGALTPVIIKLFGLFGLNDPSWNEIAHKISFPTAFIIITVLHIVFGELAPKSIAIRKPTSTTFFVAIPLKVFHFIFQPIIWTMNGFANLMLKAIGINIVQGIHDVHSEEELKMIISESQEGGAIEETERNLIQNVFKFDDRTVAQIQTQRKNVSAIEIHSNVKEALEYAIKEGYSRYPVYEDDLDDIKGILYTKDLVKYVLNKPETIKIKDIVREPEFVSENSKIKNVLKSFQQKRTQMAIVTNEVGELTGIVSMEDILEELVGEIQDEYDNEDPGVIKIGENAYVVNAHFNISDINRSLPIQFSESEEYETLAGLIAYQYPDIEIKQGDILTLSDYQIKILKMYRNSVEKVKLSVDIAIDAKESE
ncbi:MAG: HlyC/CorC family transporter [Bacteroidetes bacterium]|nr:HlyC/CorC family transporter [Bacteroidota bacterium]